MFNCFSTFACEKLDLKNNIHMQTWLSLLSTRDLKMVSFHDAGKMKMSTLPTFAKLHSLDTDQPQVQDAIEELTFGMQNYLSKRWQIDSSTDISLIIENELRQDGSLCDFANQLDSAIDLKAK